MEVEPITALFLDVGGVLLTNGWDHNEREAACKTFSLDYEDMNERHHLTFDTYEEGKLSLDEYLDRVVFYQERPFSRADFKQYMYSQSKPYPRMIDLVRKLKAQYGLKVAVVSNEGRELAEYRIKTFDLGAIVDFYIFSCFVHFRKPDRDIFCIALDIAQVPPSQVAYIEDRNMFVEVAQSVGIRGIRHVDEPTTQARLGTLGLALKGE